MTTGRDIIDMLDLKPHPEGGWYRQTWIAQAKARPTGSCIYFLLQAGEVSHWHRIDAAEIWHHYAGAPLILSLAETTAGPAKQHILGKDLAAGQRPQVIVPAGYWQSATTTGAFSLVGCTVSPAFQFDTFELAPSGFSIPGPNPKKT